MTQGYALELPRIPDSLGFGPRAVSLSKRLENGPSGVFGFFEPREAKFDHRLDRADEHVARSRWDLALRMYEEVLQDDPYNRRALNGAARVYAVKGRRRKVVDACHRWLEQLEATNQWGMVAAVGEAILRFDASSEQARLHIALARLRGQDFAGALASLRELSLILLERGDTEESLQLLERAWSVVPTDYPTGMALAEVYILTGSFEQAGRHLRNLAAVLVEQGQDELAAEVYQRLTVISPERSDVVLSLGRLYLAMGRYPAAIGEFRSLLRRDGDPRPALLLLAEACLLNKQYEDASLAARRVLIDQPDNREALSLLGTALRGMGLDSEADGVLPAPRTAPPDVSSLKTARVRRPVRTAEGLAWPEPSETAEPFALPENLVLPVLPERIELVADIVETAFVPVAELQPGPELPVLPLVPAQAPTVSLTAFEATPVLDAPTPEELLNATPEQLAWMASPEPLALPLLPPEVEEEPEPVEQPLPNPLLLRHGIQAAARLLDDPWLAPEERVDALDSLCQAVRWYARSLPRERRQVSWSAQEQQIEQAVAVLRPVPLDGNLVRLTLWRGIQASGALLSEPRLPWERKLEAQTVLALAAEAYARAIPCERAEEAYASLERLLHNHDWSRTLGPSQRLAVWRGIQACGTLMLEREDSPEDRVRLLETLCQAGRLYALEVPLPDPNAAFEALARVLYATDPRLTDGPLTQHALWKGIQAAGGLLDDPQYPADRRQEVLGALCETARAFARLAPPPEPDALDRLKSLL